MFDELSVCRIAVSVPSWLSFICQICKQVSWTANAVLLNMMELPSQIAAGFAILTWLIRAKKN